MDDRRLRFIAWLGTTLAVAGLGFLAYRAITDPGELPGRTDLGAALDDPPRIVTDPGAIGSAIEARAHAAVARCMAAAGFDYRGPATIASDLDEVADPAIAGYGIAAGVEDPILAFTDPEPDPRLRTPYEAALYGTALGDGEGDGGCAAAGRREVAAAFSTVTGLPYTIEQLERDLLAHPSYRAALVDWQACMRDKGWDYDSPEAIIDDLRARLSASRGDDARDLAAEERRIAVDDHACREPTLDPAFEEAATDLGPEFVEANRTELETLLPVDDEDPDLPPDLGSGDVQVSLRWPSEADLDLAVTDPDGTRIDYNNRAPGTGGQLDRDANAGCTTSTVEPGEDFIENVFWPRGEAPSGEYTARVNVFSVCGAQLPLAYELIVQVDGRVVEWVRSEIESGSVTVEFSR